MTQTIDSGQGRGTAHAAPTLDEVAQAAGVSRSTASRAINGGHRVSPEAQLAVDDAVERLGYVPNRAARSLVTRRTGSVALVLPEPDERVLNDPFLTGTLRGVSSALGTSELQLVLIMARPGDQDGRIARYLGGGHVDGAIVASHHREDGLEEDLARSGMPSVFVGRPFEPENHLYVDVDNFDGGRQAAQRLIDRGCRRITTISGPLDMTAGIDRLDGWAAALRAAGFETDGVEHGDFTMAAGSAAAERLLARVPDLDGIFAASDAMAAGAVRVLREHGLSVPDDVAVVGYDDLGFAVASTPQLTTVTNPVSVLAGEATMLLLDVLAGAEAPVAPTVLPAELVVRASA
ncbi:LacI family DNA-binding transcriptional regulator [Cellulomonas sp. PhB143]|uniref:LacI family DNA-binding transcriptional regulator n=1 Tax=Cellulomonas sp. PhB143 TaxID=2485186 RepID=UPI000F4999E7|nr:LacI family DNA-binding transcriptional regulator [Cellulomonas sp. PhB143]ROS78598.1 LacI family transcriptional regulator [Cellulomonas sp. PhB143]